jgi:DNA-binding SARP family transcriptional activator
MLPEAAEHLLAFLAVRDKPVRRSHMAAVFWSEASEKQGMANLRSALWRLVGPQHDALDVGTRSVGVRSWVQVDLHEAAALARRLIDKRCPVTQDELATASGLLRDNLLPDWYDEWAIQESERWRQLRLHALEALAQRLIEAGRIAQALDAALLCVEADPLRESAHTEVIRAHLAEHNRSEAIRAFDNCRSIVRRELGLEPSEELRALLGPSATQRTSRPVSRLPMRRLEALQRQAL